MSLKNPFLMSNPYRSPCMMTDYRYPGSRSFQDTDLDRKLFFGRDKEKAELLHLILAEKLVVLFAKSGMGKTSLLKLIDVLQSPKAEGDQKLNELEAMLPELL